jgi:hypothetical protein
MAENTLMIGTDAVSAEESIHKSPGPSSAPCATARQSRAKSFGVEFKSACAGRTKQKVKI